MLADYIIFYEWSISMCLVEFFFFQAEDGIRYLVRSRGLGDVYKRQQHARAGRSDRSGVHGGKLTGQRNASAHHRSTAYALSLIHI